MQRKYYQYKRYLSSKLIWWCQSVVPSTNKLAVHGGASKRTEQKVVCAWVSENVDSICVNLVEFSIPRNKNKGRNNNDELKTITWWILQTQSILTTTTFFSGIRKEDTKISLKTEKFPIAFKIRNREFLQKSNWNYEMLKWWLMIEYMKEKIAVKMTQMCAWVDDIEIEIKWLPC